MTTFTHKITDVQTYSKDGLDNIVYTVRYELEGKLNGRTHKSFMLIKFSEPDPSVFTEFSKLTEAEILAWVVEQLGQEQINELEYGIDSYLNEVPDPLTPPVVTSQALPWETAKINLEDELSTDTIVETLEE
jgi:hypothetical protein